MLEQFWLELSESFVDLDKVTLPPSSSSIPKFVEDMLVSSGYNYYSICLPTHQINKEIILLKQ